MDRGERGFTLVEMSLVLIVIGLILGGVAIGKDVQRNAEYAKIKQKFVDQWVSAYNTYYQRAGVVVGDSQIQPRMMVNGDTYTSTDSTVISGQDMSSVTAPNAICEGAQGPDMDRDADLILHQEMDRMGVRMPPAVPKVSKTAISIWIPMVTPRSCRSASSGIHRAPLPMPATSW